VWNAWWGAFVLLSNTLNPIKIWSNPNSNWIQFFWKWDANWRTSDWKYAHHFHHSWLCVLEKEKKQLWKKTQNEKKHLSISLKFKLKSILVNMTWLVNPNLVYTYIRFNVNSKLVYPILAPMWTLNSSTLCGLQCYHSLWSFEFTSFKIICRSNQRGTMYNLVWGKYHFLR
jgi:hypothetical protein